MTPALRLLPNLGGEEAGDWRQGLERPPVAAAAHAWRLLFPDSARPLADPPPGWWDLWPEAFEPVAGRAAFSWLDDLEGGVAWLGSRNARREMESHGVVALGPPPEVVERVHDKAFALHEARALGLEPDAISGLPQILDASLLQDPEAAAAEIRDRILAWPHWARASARLKPRNGTSGRGQHELAAESPPSAASLRVLARQGGAVLEPGLARTRDLSTQLRIGDAEGVVILGSLRLLTTADGGFLGQRGEVDSRGRVFSGDPEDEALREAAACLAVRAREAGYLGPAGVDSFAFLHPESGDEQLRPVVELNARFTMGTVAIGLVRRSLELVRERLDLRPGQRRAFWFTLRAPDEAWLRAEAAAPDEAFRIALCEETTSGAGEPHSRAALFFARDAAVLDALGAPPT